MIKHRIIKGICYTYEVKEAYQGRCKKHNVAKSKQTAERPLESGED